MFRPVLQVKAIADAALWQEAALFGLCLGLQSLVGYFGGFLGELAAPMHGKASLLTQQGSSLFRAIANQFTDGH